MVYVEILIMDAKKSVEEGIADVIRTYELLDRARTGKDIVIRDDQFDPEALLDAARLSRSRGIRMGVLDTGRFDVSGLGWLLREGVRLFTSDEARPSARELGLILESALKAGTSVACFRNGPLPSAPAPGESPAEPEKGGQDPGPQTGAAAAAAAVSAALAGSSGPDTVSSLDLRLLLSDGLDLHVSNVAHPRDPAVLADLADAAASGKSYLVYYHHGPVDEGLPALAARRAWVHVSDRALRDDEAEIAAAAASARAARAAGSRTIVHIEEGLALDPLSRLFAAGAVVIFHTAPAGYRSLLRSYEARAARQKLPARASYLTTAFLP